MCSLGGVIVVGGLALSTDTSNAQAGGEETSIRLPSKHTNADIFFSSPKRYAVISDHKKKIQRLYAKGSLLFQEKSWTPLLIIERIEPQGVLFRQTKTDRKELLPFGHPLPGLPHLTLVKDVAVTEIRYGFKVVEEQPDQEPVIQRIEGSRAYLLKEVLKESLTSTRQTLLQTSVPSARPSSSSGDPISKIQVTQLDEDNFEVDKESLRPLANSVRGGLGNLVESFGLAFSVVTPTRLELTSSLGDATVSQQGFTITRFGFNRTDELGLKLGDRIVSINDKSVTSPLNAWGVVRILLAKNKELNQLRVQVVRDDLPITKTYHLK
jgi:hypothetical protein